METKEVIGRKELLEEIVSAIRDYFVAETQVEENVIVLRFVGGQKFRLTVEEA